MKKFFAAGFVAAALVSAPAFAADMPVKAAAPAVSPLPTWSGYVDIYGGGGWTTWHDDPGIHHGHPGVLGGDARVNIWLLPSWSTQIDAEGETTSRYKDTNGPNTLNHPRFSYTFGSHTAWRDPNRGSIGWFSSFVTANNMVGNGGPSQTNNWALYGGEAQQYLGQWTLYEQGGYLAHYNGSGGLTNGEPSHMWFGRGVARYFWTPDDMFSAEIGYAQGPANSGSPGERDRILNWGAAYEKKFTGTPYAVFVQYAGYKMDTNQSVFHMNEHLVLAGIRLYFGRGTLQSNDRTGASYDQPKFIRALPWSWWVF